MPYFAADFAQPLVPQLGFPITRRSDSQEKPYKKGRARRFRARPLSQFFTLKGCSDSGLRDELGVEVAGLCPAEGGFGE
jgi:hypothetical protein